MTKIVLFGDPDVTSDADDIYTAGTKEQNVDLYVNIGDNGYDGANPVELLEKYFPKDSEQYKKLVLVLGNHDDGESESDSTEEKCGAYLPEQYATKPEFAGTDQSWQDTRWLTSRQVGDIFFIGMNSQDMDIEFKRNQFNWVTQQIELGKKLRAEGKIKWILNAVHKPWFTLKSSHSPYTAVREIYSELFKNVVNQNWHGHNHNDQSWWSMIATGTDGNAAGEQLQTLLPDGKTIDHSKPHGWTTNVNGHSGHEHNKFKETASANKNVMWSNDKTFSYTVVESNGDILNTKWKDKSGAVLHEYNISMAGGVVQPPECTDPAKCIDSQTGECRPIGINEHKSPTNGTCMPNVPVDCPPGQHKDPVTGICVPDVPGTTICPRDYHFDISLQKCIPDLEPQINPVCPTGTKWNGSVCVPDGTTPPVGCPDGQCKDATTGQCRPIGANEFKDPFGMCKPKPTIICPDGQCKDTSTGLCRPIGVNEEKDSNGFCKPKQPEPGGEVDEHGIKWLVAKGKKTIVTMSRDEATDDRWSGNVTGLMNGFESTFIGKSKGTNDSSHFAMKQFSGNHSGSGAEKNAWYDTGLRVDGTVQLQTEYPHPNNHDFSLSDAEQFIKKISKGLEGNWIGLKWCVMLVKPNGTRKDGIRLRMWVDEDPLDATTNKPNNNWKLVYDFIDTGQVIPADKQLVDEQDCEVRRSDTDAHDIYGDGKVIENAKEGAPGLHVRPLT